MKRASCGLIYGAMNTTKTTNLGRVARYLHDKHGLRSRLISADNEYDTLEDLIGEGVIEPFAIASVPNPFPIMTKLSLGMWPVLENGQIVMRETAADQWPKIGAYLVEGTTTIAELLHQDHIRKARKIGEDVVGQFTEEGITFAKSAMSHYGHVQDFVTLDLIPRFSTLPVKWVFWTGHEYQGEDEATGQTRLGPGVVGKAATMKVPRKLGNTFHCIAFENVQTDPKTHKTTRSTEYRAYFEPHADAYSRTQMWPAGVKVPVKWVAEWRTKFPDGYIPLTLEKGIEQFLEFQDEMTAKYGAPDSDVGNLIAMPAAAASTASPAAASSASQTRPLARSVAYARPSRFPVRPAQPAQPAQPTLEEQLQKSVDLAHAQQTEIPDINAVPGNVTDVTDKG
jgi:hypothetical protein